MPLQFRYDAVVVGSGPNGLSAAITLARAGRSVLIIEGSRTIGGGCRTQELTLPGYLHDLCASMHPLAAGSPFFRSLPLEDLGMKWVHSSAPVAHPLANGEAVIIERSVDLTAQNLGRDGATYRRLLHPFVDHWDQLVEDLLSPLGIPKHPVLFSKFGLPAVTPSTMLATVLFKDQRARAVFAGMAAHSMLPLNQVITSAFGLAINTTAHAVGWPIVEGGSQRIVDAMAAFLISLGGEIVTDTWIQSLEQLPPTRSVLLDLTPHQFIKIADDQLPSGYKRQLKRYRYGMGVCKVDYALDGPIPWKVKVCLRANTLHIGGTLDEIAASESAAWSGKHAEKPFMIAAQQTLEDPTRAPKGKHTVWAYCHVPNGSNRDMSEIMDAQIERYAPGFRDCILHKTVHTVTDMHTYNPNYVGGDINGGVQDIWQFFTRPILSFKPYVTPLEGVYLCSSSTPPGGGVHGMSGFYAAQAALRKDGV